jgi:hypothetical protein
MAKENELCGVSFPSESSTKPSHVPPQLAEPQPLCPLSPSTPTFLIELTF